MKCYECHSTSEFFSLGVLYKCPVLLMLLLLLQQLLLQLLDWQRRESRFRSTPLSVQLPPAGRGCRLGCCEVFCCHSKHLIHGERQYPVRYVAKISLPKSNGVSNYGLHRLLFSVFLRCRNVGKIFPSPRYAMAISPQKHF